MKTRHLVDPELVALLDQGPTPVLTAEIVRQSRAIISQAPANVSQSSTLSVSERFIPGPKGAPNVRVLVYLPTSVQEPLPVLLWIHGGGYVMGSADAEDFRVKNIVSAEQACQPSCTSTLAPTTASSR